MPFLKFRLATPTSSCFPGSSVRFWSFFVFCFYFFWVGGSTCSETISRNEYFILTNSFFRKEFLHHSPVRSLLPRPLKVSLFRSLREGLFFPSHPLLSSFCMLQFREDNSWCFDELLLHYFHAAFIFRPRKVLIIRILAVLDPRSLYAF